MLFDILIPKFINTKDIHPLAPMGASILLSRSFNETKDTVDSGKDIG
jgi:hypothetical protein